MAARRAWTTPTQIKSRRKTRDSTRPMGQAQSANHRRMHSAYTICPGTSLSGPPTGSQLTTMSEAKTKTRKVQKKAITRWSAAAPGQTLRSVLLFSFEIGSAPTNGHRISASVAQSSALARERKNTRAAAIELRIKSSETTVLTPRNVDLERLQPRTVRCRFDGTRNFGNAQPGHVGNKMSAEFSSSTRASLGDMRRAGKHPASAITDKSNNLCVPGLSFRY